MLTMWLSIDGEWAELWGRYPSGLARRQARVKADLAQSIWPILWERVQQGQTK